MMLLFMREKNQMLKKFTLIQIFYPLGPNIFALHFLMNGPKKRKENLFSKNQTFTDLCNFCLEVICEEPKILFNSDEFINLKAPLLELLLKRDDLNMDEIEIWESLLKWCFAQQNMKNDPIKLNKEDITKIER